jgi:hypothetical protein
MIAELVMLVLGLLVVLRAEQELELTEPGRT